MTASPTADAIEDLARALCRASGHDPDQLVVWGGGFEPMRGPRGSVVVNLATPADPAMPRPAWRLFFEDAVVALSHVNKLIADARTMLADSQHFASRPVFRVRARTSHIDWTQ